MRMEGHPDAPQAGRRWLACSAFARARPARPVQVNGVKNVTEILFARLRIGLISVTSRNGEGFARIHICDITSRKGEPAGSVLQCSVQHP